MSAGRAEYDAKADDRKKEKDMMEQARRQRLADLPGFEESEKERVEQVQQLLSTKQL